MKTATVTLSLVLIVLVAVAFVPVNDRLVIYSSEDLTQQEQAAIYSALSQLFVDVKHRKYSRKTKHSDYTVTIKDDCVKFPEATVWKVRLDEYNGSIYDVNEDPVIGEVYARELVALPDTNITICKDTPYNMALSTRYGGEHIILYYNDKWEFYRTQVHLTENHPIIPTIK